MRLLITAGFLGHFGETDGVTTTYRNLIPLLERARLEIDLVSYGPEDRAFARGAVRSCVHRPRLPLRVDPRRWVDLAFAGTRLAGELARTPYSIVQSSTPDPMGVWAGGVARRQGCPFVAVYHTALAHYAAIRGRQAAGPVVGWLMGRGMRVWLDRYYGRAQLVLAPSESVRAELAARLRPPVAVLGRGVDSEAFHPAKRRRFGRVQALYVGRLAPEKNLELLVRVFASRTDVDLRIVGDGPAAADLHERLPRAAFAGRLEGEELARAYADGDFFVFPSRTDTLGNVVLEAMASGLPVVVTDGMGPKELIRHGVTGFVASRDEEFAGWVQTLATGESLRRAMGRAARRFAETRSWAAISEQLLGHYAALAGQGPVSRPAALHAPAEGRLR